MTDLLFGSSGKFWDEFVRLCSSVKLSKKLEEVGEMIKKRLLYGLAMVVLAIIVLGGGAIIFALLLGRDIGDMLYAASYLLSELLIILAVFFVLAFFLCPIDSTDESKKDG